MGKEDYQFYKSMGVCPVCHKSKPAPGKALCWSCEQKRKESALKYNHTHKEKIYERSHTREAMLKHAERSQKYRDDHRKRGLCRQCSRPATHGNLCELHWQRYRQQHPLKGETRELLPVPDAGYGSDMKKDREKKRLATDIITLRNAGWGYEKIADELRVTYGCVAYYLQKAKKKLQGQEKGGRVRKQYALWDNGKFAGEYTSKELAEKLFTSKGYISQAMHEEHTIAGRYQITESGATAPPLMHGRAAYTLTDDYGNVVFHGTAAEIAAKFHLGLSTVYSAACRSGFARLRGKYTVTKDQEGGADDAGEAEGDPAVG